MRSETERGSGQTGPTLRVFGWVGELIPCVARPLFFSGFLSSNPTSFLLPSDGLRGGDVFWLWLFPFNASGIGRFSGNRPFLFQR